MTAPRGFWSTWWPFGLAWPATALLFVLAGACADRLQSRLPIVILFPLAAVLSTAGLSRSILVPLGVWVQFPTYALAARLGVRGRPRRTVAAVLVLVHLVGVGAGSPVFWGPSLGAYRRSLAEAAGPGAQDCGIVALDEDRRDAVACARAALAQERAFFVAFQVMGIDSTVYEGLACRGRGRATLFGWDSDVSGGFNLVPLRRIRQEPCDAVTVADGGSPVVCSEPPHATSEGRDNRTRR